MSLPVAAGLALLFPGQGCAEAGMGVELAARSAAARAVFEEASAWLDLPLLDLCREGGPRLQLTEHQQPALLACELAHLAAWRALAAEEETAVAGHSLGQLAALVAAGAIDHATAFHLVRERAQAMREAGEAAPGAMAAVIGWPKEQVLEVCARAGPGVWLAAHNAPDQVVISGRPEVLAAASRSLLEAGVDKVVRLGITVAAHTPLMEEAASRLRRVVRSISIAPARVPVVSNLDGRPLTSAEDLGREISQGLVAPVRWLDGLRTLWRLGVRSFVELGPRPTLSNLLPRVLPEAEASCPDALALAGGVLAV
jgi:[acyl-carrier-protein] S-malonyltransferase